VVIVFTRLHHRLHLSCQADLAQLLNILLLPEAEAEGRKLVEVVAQVVCAQVLHQ